MRLNYVNIMKQPVKISICSMVLSVLTLIIIAGVFFYQILGDHSWYAYLLYAMLLILCLGVLIYMPVSVSVDDEYLCVNRSFWVKRFPLADIKSIGFIRPPMKGMRILGSGGWFGYWGWFWTRELGTYFCYYGKASDCFLVRLKNGRMYMLGCRNPRSIVNYVSERIAGLPKSE